MTATGGKHMRKLLASGKLRLQRGGVSLDLYNNTAIPKICSTIKTNIDTSNEYWVAIIRKMSKENLPKEKGVVYTAKSGDSYEVYIRKYTPTDCYRLMGVHDEDIKTLLSVDQEGKQIISNSKHYQLAGNSIVTNCMTAMFEELFYPSGKHTADKHGQLSLF